MLGDVLMKFLVTTGGVWLVLELARRYGERLAGWTAGLPIMSGPTLVMVGLDRGDSGVAQAAIGGMLAVASSAAFAVVYLAIARSFRDRRGSRAASLVGAIAVVVVISGALGTSASAGWLGIVTAFVLAVLACIGAGAIVGAQAKKANIGGRRDGLATVSVALLVGAITTGLSCVAASLPASACGLLAGLPTTCMIVLTRQHKAQGLDGVARLLDGYVKGLGARTAFTLGVACAGTTGWAVALALGVVMGTLWSSVRVDRVVGVDWRIARRLRFISLHGEIDRSESLFHHPRINAVRATLALAVGLLGATSIAHASDYDEGVNGDLSNDAAAPTDIGSLAPATNRVHASHVPPIDRRSAGTAEPGSMACRIARPVQ